MTLKMAVLGAVLMTAGCAGPDTRHTATLHPATKTQIEWALVGRRITWSIGLVQVYGADGSYESKYGGRIEKGTYVINDDGTVCMKLTTKGGRCETILTDGSRIVLRIRMGVGGAREVVY